MAYVRSLVYLVSSALAALGYWSATMSSGMGSLGQIRLEEFYGFCALYYLIAALFISPFYGIFVGFPGKEILTHARRAIGISTFCFAIAHAAIVFFGPLEGVRGWAFLRPYYQLDLVFALIALFILFLMAATSFDYMVELLQFKNWKILHRFVYLAGILIIVHVLTIGSDFESSQGVAASFFFDAVFVLVSLQWMRTVAIWHEKGRVRSAYGAVFFIGIALIVGLYACALYLPSSPFNIHAHHLAQ